ncbi:hypothetical protein TSAR_004985 [Trichomalopsis sarcophagae]|uniref:Uncharacterized protein n=1 Tax=Trichomalopsis sarcophagae TaxID=543379 RepID=A0A232EMT5_9HYME|nr:hypothetical protein TSAR_004985 [Trichomalopsis sarcophagae]
MEFYSPVTCVHPSCSEDYLKISICDSTFDLPDTTEKFSFRLLDYIEVLQMMQQCLPKTRNRSCDENFFK